MLLTEFVIKVVGGTEFFIFTTKQVEIKAVMVASKHPTLLLTNALCSELLVHM